MPHFSSSSMESIRIRAQNVFLAIFFLLLECFELFYFRKKSTSAMRSFIKLYKRCSSKKGAKTFDIPFLMLGFWTLFEVRNSTIKTEFNWLNFPIKHNIESHFPSKFMITLFNLHVTFRRANEEYKWSTFSLWLISKCKYSVWFLDKISHFTDTFFVDIFIG